MRGWSMCWISELKEMGSQMTLQRFWPRCRKRRSGSTTVSGPLVYVPPGIYRVTKTIEKRDSKGNYDSGLMLQGAGPEHTIIQLDPDTPGFDDAANPRPVILTTSHLWGQGGPYGGGKNWPALGEGNQSFQNTIRDLSIRIGRNNPGAIAI